MAMTIKSDNYQPEILEDTVQGVFAQKNAFMGSRLSSLGIVVVEGTMPEGTPEAIGNEITIPYFGTLGEFEARNDGDAATPKKLQGTYERATITCDSLSFSVSRWARGMAAVSSKLKDPYVESAEQVMKSAERAMDRRLLTAAAAAGVPLKDVYSASSPVTLNYDLCIDAKYDGWGDEADDDIAALLVHSQVHKDLMKLKDSTGRPLLLSSQGEGGPLNVFAGVPVCVSDKVPVTGSTMTTPVSSGTTPPVLTLAGTPLGAFRLHIDSLVSHASVGSVRVSTDGGNIWSDPIAVADDGVPVAIIDPAIDSRVGVNGKTGLTMAFAAGTFNTDNLWTSSTSLKVMSMLLKKRALAFWYNRRALTLETDKNIHSHSEDGAMHLYGAAHRYRRMPGGTKPGIVQIVHNTSGF
jgi:hypothetical protein